MNNFSGQLGDPPVRENEDFIFAYYAQQESEAGKIRNQSRVINNVLSGRSGVKKGSDLNLAEIALIVTAERKSHKRCSVLTVESLAKNSKTQARRRTEAFALLNSWVSGEKRLHIETAKYLLQADEDKRKGLKVVEKGNILTTRRLGLEYVALEVKQAFDEQLQADREKFASQQAGNHDSKEGDDEDMPMVPLFDLSCKTPSPAPSPSKPDRNFGIHHSMVDFHIPFSHQADEINGIFHDEAPTTQSNLLLAAVLVDDVLQHNIGVWKLTQDQMSLLVNADIIPKYSFNRLLSHCAAYKRIDQATLDYILAILHTFQPVIDYATLPRCAKTLLRVSKKDIADCCGDITDIHGRRLDPLPDDPPGGRYMHLGIAKAILAESPGLVNTYEYVNTLRTVFYLWPELFTEEMRAAVIRPRRGEEFQKDILEKWQVPKPDHGLKQKINIEIHGHIDGVQLFKNSAVGKGVPILGRVTAIADKVSGKRITLPPLEPFVIGVMHETGDKPNIWQFSTKFVDELKVLSSRKSSGHSFTVTMTAMICDAPERADLKGVQGATGYDACERCRIRGEYHEGCVRYTAKRDNCVRRDEDWHKYKKKDPRRDKAEKLHFHLTRPHRRPGSQSIFCGRLVFKNILGFPLECMHLVDGGVLKDLLTLMRSVARKSKNRVSEDIEKARRFLNKFRCLEQSRELRSMNVLEKWKMREFHVFFMYFAYAIYSRVCDRLAFAPELLNAMRHLLAALHLVKGFYSKEIPAADITKAQTHIDSFLEIYEEQFGLSAMTYKMHSLAHMLEDVIFHKCHLEYLSSYPYENFHGKWRVFLRSGRLPLEQIRNRLIELHKYVLPIETSGKGVTLPLDYSPEEFRYMKENNTVELPPNFPRRVVRLTKEASTGPTLVVNKVKHYRLKNPAKKPRKVRTAKFRYLEFRGSMVARDVFPHNILLMKNGSVVFATRYSDSLDLGKEKCDPSDIRVVGHEFQSVESVFTDPCDSSSIGMTRVSKLSLVTNEWNARDIESKCIILPDDDKFPNPLPEEVRLLADSIPEMRAKHTSIFGKTAPQTWTVISLLLPNRH